jgi:hypothetical protein
MLKTYHKILEDEGEAEEENKAGEIKWQNMLYYATNLPGSRCSHLLP